MLVLLMGGIYKVCAEMGSVYFMTIGSGVQAILRICLRNLWSRNVGISDDGDLWSTSWDGLRCHDIHTKFHKDWFRHWRAVRGDSHANTRAHRLQGDALNIFLFFQKLGSRSITGFRLKLPIDAAYIVHRNLYTGRRTCRSCNVINHEQTWSLKL
jgi:hypothetical protein